MNFSLSLDFLIMLLETCMIHLTDYIKSQTAKGNYTGMILIDMQKAFDTVNHDILCKKLKAMGVKSTKWFQSYLSERTQLVSVNGATSGFENVSSGVPQGSILGPLLYLCYVNDVKISVSCKIILYADDSALLVSGKNLEWISSTLSKELENCNNWLVDNHLSMHLDNTECILFGTKRKINKAKNFSVKYKDQEIKSQECVKYLGVELDQSLSGEKTVNNIIKKSSDRLKFMYRQGKYLDTYTRRLLCNALIQPLFDYCATSWYVNIPKKSKKQLQVMQNKVIRYILNLSPRSHVGSQEFNKVKMLDVSSRIKLLRLNHVFNIYYNQCPAYLKENFVRLNDLHDHNTRGSKHNFVVHRGEGSEASSFHRVATGDWNSLPEDIKRIKNKLT